MDFDQLHIEAPPRLEEYLASVRTLAIESLDSYETRVLPLESIAEYSHSAKYPSKIPRPHEHFVIGDFLIDLPVIAIDLAVTSATYGRVIAYCAGDSWVLASSYIRWFERWKTERDVNDLVYGEESGLS